MSRDVCRPFRFQRKNRAGEIIAAPNMMTTSVLSQTARVWGEKIQELFMQTEPQNELKGVEFSNEIWPKVNTCLLSGAVSTRGLRIDQTVSIARPLTSPVEEMADLAAGNGEER
ncbi:hypothetical protein GGC47_004817 [Bosea sp. OAE752]|uniref:hypothetical protein n=1 Tax=Bosea sp. OAE752 TaxID=2663873 RepID=UPI003D234FE8